MKRLVKSIWLLVVSVAAVLGWLIIQATMSGSQVFETQAGSGAPSLQTNKTPSPLNLSKEGDGRITVLILGRGGANHPGGTLTDSIQLFSIDPVNKTAAMLSLPRDLLVKLPGGSYSKINAVYSYAEQNKKGSGAGASADAIANLLDLPIHYYVDVDFQGFKDIVDAIGGVDVNIKQGFTDSSFPDDKMQGYAPFTVKAGAQHMNGTVALKYARSRHGTNGEGSDFARSRRQQEIMKAARDKALTASVLANPIKLTNLMQAVGAHLRTSIPPASLDALRKLLGGVSMDGVKTNVIDNSADLGLLVDGPSNSQFGYHLIPKLGQSNYLEIQRFAHTVFAEPYLVKEAPVVELVDASGTKKGAAEVTKTLKAYGYNVLPDISTATTQKTSQLLDLSGGSKPYSMALLSKRFRLTATKAAKGESLADIRLIIGNADGTAAQTTPKALSNATASPK